MTDELNKKPDEEVVESSEPSTTNPEVAASVAGKLANQTPGDNPYADRAAVQDAIAQQTSNPSTVQQPVVPTEEKPEVKDAPQYLTDWSKVGNVYEEAKKLNLPLAQVLQDYQRWGNETGNPTYWINAMFQDADLSKSVADNEEAKKMQERKERWDKVNNFLMHLGNAIGNVASGNYGSVKLEDPVQWTERQRLLKEKGLEQRRLNNQSILQQMHKNWADERNYELRKQMAEANAAARQASANATTKRAEDQGRVADSTIKKNEAATERIKVLTPVEKDQKVSAAEKNRRPSTGRRGSSGNTTTVRVVENDLDDYGHVRSSKSTTTKTVGTSQQKRAKGEKKSTGVKWVTKPKK